MQWLDIWGHQQQDYRSWPSVVENEQQTIRMRLNHHATKLRLKFSNLYGSEAIIFEKIEVQLLDEQGKVTGTTMAVNGGDPIIIPSGVSKQVSEPIEVFCSPNQILEVRTYLKRETQLTGGIVSYSRLQQEVLNYHWAGETQGNFIDQKERFRIAKENQRMFYIYGIAGIQAETEGQTIVAFGDSLTQQGFWVDALKQRIQHEGNANVAVINKGIGGGRILRDTNPEADSYQRHGRSGLKRYLLDTFEVENVNTVIVSHGINDILTWTERQSSRRLIADIINGLIFYAEEAWLRNATPWIATLMPFKGSDFYSYQQEELREQVNAWIRNQKLYAGVVDFDHAVRAEDHRYVKRAYECGDGLHLSAKGGQAAAKAFDLNQLCK